MNKTSQMQGIAPDKQNHSLMPRQRRTFKLEEKLRIIREAGEQGISATRLKYKLAHSVLLRWRNEYKSDLLKEEDHILELESTLKKFEEENTRLKKIIAEQVLELQIKSEIIQKIKNQK